MRLKTFIPCLLLLISCDYIINLKRTGDIITKEFEWNGASKIEIWAPVRLIPVNSDTSKIEITGMDFIVNDYELIQSEEKLVIEHKNISRIQESKIADLILYAPSFEVITINSPCKLYCEDTLHIDKLQVVVNGEGVNTKGSLILKGNSLNFAAYGMSKCIMNLSGNLNAVSYVLEGGAIINALKLPTQNTKIKHKSYADCHVNVSKLLDVKIYAPGNVYYKGNPEVTEERIENNLLNATGKVIKIND